MAAPLSRRTFLLASAASLLAQGADLEELDFLRHIDEFENIHQMLWNFLLGESKALLAKRVNSLAVSTPEGLAERREYLRKAMLRAIGGLPEPTPLNARITGTVQRDGYRIEKVVFESQPGFYVTANLYLPAGRGPFPGILYPLGHELGAKAHETWQQMLVTLARRGYVALTWDTVGQGERIQLYDPDFRDSKVVSSTTEHTVQGIQCLLTGQHIARYTIWDGLKALDYLLSRPEVDATKIACTGNSGGGTHTAYLSALDDRIKVAAPSCYITSWRILLEALGPQDAEQVFPNWLRDGLDFPDFLYAAAPKPYLVLSGIQDFFPINGARESFREAVRFYPQGKLKMVEADDPHGYSQPRRMAAYDWFAHWLKNSEDHEAEIVVKPESEETLYCTPSGQVSTSLGGETIFTLNRAHGQKLRTDRLRLSKAEDFAAFQTRIRRAAIQRSGFKAAVGELKATPYGVLKHESFHIEKFVYETDPGILIPALVYVPQNGPARKPAVVLVDGGGKSAAARTAEQLTRVGAIVLSIDARGFGETKNSEQTNASDFYRYFGNYEAAMTGVMIGRTLVAMRALDVLRGVDLLSVRPDIDTKRISALGRRGGAAPVLYAALFDERLHAVALDGMLLSYEAVVNERIHRQIFEDIVPSALEDFDLPDLAAALAPRSAWIFSPRSPQGIPVMRREFEDAYASAAKPSSIKLQSSTWENDYQEFISAEIA